MIIDGKYANDKWSTKGSAIRGDYLTISEWLSLLPKKIRHRAFRNTGITPLGEQKSNFATAIDNAFQWSGTDEGDSYWHKMFNLAIKFRHVKPSSGPTTFPDCEFDALEEYVGITFLSNTLDIDEDDDQEPIDDL